LRVKSIKDKGFAKDRCTGYSKYITNQIRLFKTMSM